MRKRLPLEHFATGRYPSDLCATMMTIEGNIFLEDQGELYSNSFNMTGVTISISIATHFVRQGTYAWK